MLATPLNPKPTPPIQQQLHSAHSPAFLSNPWHGPACGGSGGLVVSGTHTTRGQLSRQSWRARPRPAAHVVQAQRTSCRRCACDTAWAAARVAAVMPPAPPARRSARKLRHAEGGKWRGTAPDHPAILLRRCSSRRYMHVPCACCTAASSAAASSCLEAPLPAPHASSSCGRWVGGWVGGTVGCSCRGLRLHLRCQTSFSGWASARRNPAPTASTEMKRWPSFSTISLSKSAARRCLPPGSARQAGRRRERGGAAACVRRAAAS